MKLRINGEIKEVPDGLTIAGLLGQLQVNPPYAVELNHQVCPKGRHAQTPLNEGDKLEIVTIAGGG